jgi:phosphate/sulfate permease
MKKAIPLNQLSVEELYKKKQSMLGALIGLGVVILAASGILFYLVFTAKTPKVLAALPISCLLALLPAMISLSQINTEIKNRNSK